ncbi:MAG: chemotaxis protein CheW [Spirochaetes bacterium GWD1_27_9]|nr:MAG: chemotaxis protein CheW [Spirochaetes bacterium GWB1_27_13]OHD25632.1 MAG: chemotaxis protein CheW [Spirochaetes bacterium GWC1_27_15]OHD36159.1 MAG: chemotaxis protein CheW [Spirochaetes bacterium GWD1_27_9]
MNNINKYLIFSVSNEFYGLPIMVVREIIRYEKITPMRDVQKYLKGVINLRGKIIPIIDMRLKFGITENEYNDRTIFIIVDINGEKEIFNIGIAVDSVSDVVDIESTNIDSTPELGFKLKNQYLKGIAKIKSDMVMILDIDKIIKTDEIIENLSGKNI